MINRLLLIFRSINLEAAFWIAGLIFLFFLPFGSGSHFTICPLKNTGFSFCPGCGLGQSIHYLFFLDFQSSFASHPLGIFALLIISSRIVTVIKKNLTINKILHSN